MIVRDEASNLADCLRSCAGLFAELVIVDTGSRDGTREIARSFGARVVDFEWCDDFSAARNESLRHVSGEWTFWLDADDRIDAANQSRLAALFEGLEPAMGYTMRVASREAHGWLPQFDQLRLFSRGSASWRGRVHEEMLLDESVGIRRSSAVIHHLGYMDQDVLRRKTERNLRLLRLKLADSPGDARTMMHLAGELLNTGLAQEAYPFFCRASQLAASGVSWRLTAIYGRAAAAHRMGVYDADAVAELAMDDTAESIELLGRLRLNGVNC